MKVLGIDIGVSSIGWAIIEDDELKDCGVRIFNQIEVNAKANRRIARGTRVRLRRRKGRMNIIKSILCGAFNLNLDDYISESGNLPKAFSPNAISGKSGKSPYFLRDKALREKLEIEEFVRIILHIAKHRGYGNKHAKESNNKDDKQEGEIKKALQEMGKRFEQCNYETIGQFLYREFECNKKAVRNKAKEVEKSQKSESDDESKKQSKKQPTYNQILKQEWLKDELKIIFDKQKDFGFNFEKLNTNELLEKIFYQRPLRDFSAKVGECTFEEKEKRACKASISAIEFIALGKIINTLQNITNKTGEVFDNQDKILKQCTDEVLQNGKLSYKKFREIIKLDSTIRFNDKKLQYGKNNENKVQIIESKEITKLKKELGKDKYIAMLKNQQSSLDEFKKDITQKIINTLQNITNKTGEVFDNQDEILKQCTDEVLQNGKLSYKKLREIIKLDSRFPFSDDKLKYGEEDNESSVKIIESKEITELKNALGKDEYIAMLEQQRDLLNKIATEITLTKDRVKLKEKLEKYNADSKILTDEQIEKLSNLSFKHHIRLSFKALNKILPFMQSGKRYDEACALADLKEHKKAIEKSKFLPPFEEFATETNNAVVCRAVAQYRKIINALIKKYGAFHKINIELAREIGISQKEREKIENEQEENQKRKKDAQKQCEDWGIEPNDKNILKMRLFIEQDEFCVYSGKKITREHLIDSTALQIDHIYPYSRSFDDSYMNKVLVFTKYNQEKKNKTPFEAFGENKEQWNNIVALITKLPKQKQRRISNKKFKDKNLDEKFGENFISRNLNDTRYIAKLIKNYTESCLEMLPIENKKKHIMTTNGFLTATMRHYIGFDEETQKQANIFIKDRDNHLHHAIDAIIIAYMNESIVQRFANFKKEREELKKAQEYATAQEYADELKKHKKEAFKLPISHKNIEEKIKHIFVSKPPRKRTYGALHKETYRNKDKFEKDYGGEQGIDKALELGKIRKVKGKLVNNGEMVRVDIFRDKKGNFYGVPIYTMDFALGKLPNKAVVSRKDNGVIKDWIEMDSNYKFRFSLYKDDVVEIQKKKMEKPIKCYYTGFDAEGARIVVEKPNRDISNLSDDEKEVYTGVKIGKKKDMAKGRSRIKTLKIFKKYQIDVLGKTCTLIPEEKRQLISWKNLNNHKKNV